MNILMTFDEVENCTFNPVVRSKLPTKLQTSKENQNLLYGKPETNMKKKVEEYSTSKEYKKAFMIGIFNKAMNEFREGRAVNAYKTLNTHFNLDQIRKFYNKNDPGPAPGTALYNILHPKKAQTFKEDEEQVEKMQVVINAETDDAKGKGTASAGTKDALLLDVFNLAQIIEQHQKMIERQIKRIQKSKKDFDSMGPDAGRDSARSVGPHAKQIMCPLGYVS
jgi:DNA-binding transcriptional MerR regulator